MLATIGGSPFSAGGQELGEQGVPAAYAVPPSPSPALSPYDVNRQDAQYQLTSPAFQPADRFLPARDLERSELFEAAETVARVGDQLIFRGDLVGEANIILAPFLLKMPPDTREAQRSQIDAQRDQLVKQVLQETIQRKMMYLMFLRSIPADKLQEAQKNIAERAPEQFTESLDETYEKVRAAKSEDYKDIARQNSQMFRLALLMKELNIRTQRELDLALRSYGSTLEKQHRNFIEDQLGRQELFKKVGSPREATYNEMVQYYQDHLEDFAVPLRARWEQITIRFDHYGTKYEAGEAIARIGNELFFGAPFAATAKRVSQGSDAEKGGYHDWTSWGDLRISHAINEKVFTININELSRIIEDAEGLHIIRVLERQDAHYVDFNDAQATIRKEIHTQRRNEAINEYLAKLKTEIPVWSIYDDSRPAEQVAAPPSGNNRPFPR